MAPPRERRGRPLELLSPERLARMLRLPRGHRPGRPRPQVYGEDEVRDMIYGRHSGTVEPPQPADSAGLAAAVTVSSEQSTVTVGSEQPTGEGSLLLKDKPPSAVGRHDGGEK